MKHKPRRVVPSSWLSPVTGVGVAISRVTIRISLLLYLPKMDEKNSPCSEKNFFLKCSCSPFQMLLSPKLGWQNVCQHVSHPSQQSGSQGWFCLSTRWWGGTAKGYFATLLYAPKHCLFGLIDCVAEAGTCVIWTTHSHSTASSHNKILLGVDLEYLGCKMGWSVVSGNHCSF